MKKFNRRINNECARIGFWHEINSRINSIDSLLTQSEHLTPEDIQALKVLHHNLWDCHKMAKMMLNYHNSELKGVIKHGSKVIN